MIDPRARVVRDMPPDIGKHCRPSHSHRFLNHSCPQLALWLFQHSLYRGLCHSTQNSKGPRHYIRRRSAHPRRFLHPPAYTSQCRSDR